MWNGFDILKKLPDGGIVWIETAPDLEAARKRIRLFATHKPGEYVVFCQETQAVIESASVSYSREEGQATDRRVTAKTKVNKGFAGKSAARLHTEQVVAGIVADITRTFAGKSKT
jgi:hypothetical protein